MKELAKLRDEISSALASVKAYSLPAVCTKLGLEHGEDAEAFASKRSYVSRRIQHFSRKELIQLAQKVVDTHPTFELDELLKSLAPPPDGVTSPITRREVLVAIEKADPGLSGDEHLVTFLKRVWPIEDMRSPFSAPGLNDGSLEESVYQHMVRNDDWSLEELFTVLGIVECSEQRFRAFLEAVVHPEVRKGEAQRLLVESLNQPLNNDGLKLIQTSQVSGYPVFTLRRIGRGVRGHFKNLVFASDGPKPEIVLQDAINNDIRIVKHEEHCLVYDQMVGAEGLLWRDLTSWYAELKNLAEGTDVDRELYRRLYKSLGSDPEKLLFKRFFEVLRPKLQGQLPALLPQVYLHYDPYTVQSLKGEKRLVRQRMDFLILFSPSDRVVIEVDGKQHYSSDEKPDPRKYGEMVAEDRRKR